MRASARVNGVADGCRSDGTPAHLCATLCHTPCRLRSMSFTCLGGGVCGTKMAWLQSKPHVLTEPRASVPVMPSSALECRSTNESNRAPGGERTTDPSWKGDVITMSDSKGPRRGLQLILGTRGDESGGDMESMEQRNVTPRGTSDARARREATAEESAVRAQQQRLEAVNRKLVDFASNYLREGGKTILRAQVATVLSLPTPEFSGSSQSDQD
jgi:hypothetical protein